MSFEVEPELRGLAVATSGVDPLEEQRALGTVEAALFRRRFRPIRLGRYVLLERVGGGGGGVVYSAYDPELHRRVAVKLLRSGSKSPRARTRLLREAQALARLSHPNIVGVYDVGVVTAERDTPRGVFIVMEYVEGQALDLWFRARPRSWTEIVDVMLDAGRGLAAMHREGLVHRDFKPPNVIVEPSGRARVVDFGLAGSAKSTSSPDSGQSSLHEAEVIDLDDDIEPLLVDRVLTESDAVAGTPPYMAPEQHEGRAVDVRTDVFAFCASLYQGLCGELPFSGKDLDALLARKREGPPQLDKSTGPRWLEQIIRRGLQPDPEARFTSVEELLAALARRRNGRSRRLMVALGLGGVVAAASGYVAIGREDCEAVQRLDALWDDDVARRAKRAFATADPGFGEQVWSQVAPLLGEYASQWTTERRAVCDSDAPVDERGAQALCLDRELSRFGQIVRTFASADTDIVRNAVVTAHRLDPPHNCHEASSAVRWQAQGRGATTDAMFGRDQDLLRADVLRQSGKYRDAEAIAGRVYDEAVASDDVHAAARAALVACEAAWASNRFNEADRHCRDALPPAEKSRDDVLVIETLTTLGFTAISLKQFGEAERLFDVAQARLGALAPSQARRRLEAGLLKSVGYLRTGQYRHADAIEPMSTALQAYTAAYGEAHPDAVSVLNGLGIAYGGIDRHDEARQYYERALEMAHRMYGRHHPMVASLENNLAGTYFEMGRLDAAKQHIELALRMKEQTLGTASPRLVTTLTRFGRILLSLGESDAAIPHLQRAHRLQSAEAGPDAPATAETHLSLAVGLERSDRCEEALQHLDDAQAITRRVPDALPSFAWEVPFVRARCLEKLDRLDEARASHAAAVEALRPYAEVQPRRLCLALRGLGTWHGEHGERATAVEALQEALALCQGSEGDPRQLANTAFELALLIDGHDPQQAIAYAQMAIDALASIPWATEDRARIEAWLEERT